MRDILIVEDGRGERERLLKIFTEAGYLVNACESVTDAEKLLEFESFRLAVLDVGLADKSGSYLFNAIKQRSKVSHIIIFTGNPSIHLRQRFLEGGAADYIVKGSPQALNAQLLTRVTELLGTAQVTSATGIDLEEFLQRYVNERSRPLFSNIDNTVPRCMSCGTAKYVVVFSAQAQVPPEIRGVVLCAGCGKPMDPQIS